MQKALDLTLDILTKAYRLLQTSAIKFVGFCFGLLCAALGFLYLRAVTTIATQQLLKHNDTPDYHIHTWPPKILTTYDANNNDPTAILISDVVATSAVMLGARFGLGGAIYKFGNQIGSTIAEELCRLHDNFVLFAFNTAKTNLLSNQDQTTEKHLAATSIATPEPQQKQLTSVADVNSTREKDSSSPLPATP